MLAWVAIFSTDSRRVTQCRHATKIPSPQLLLFPALTDRDACNSCRIRSYENCRVSTEYPIYPPTLLFSSAAFGTFFQVPYPVTPLLATLTKTARVCTNNSHSGTRFLTNQEIRFPSPHPIKSPHCPHPAGKARANEESL